MDPREVDAKLEFAKLRMQELLVLNAGDIARAIVDDRDRLTAEFFFHAISATEVLAQYINEFRSLGIASHHVSVTAVSQALGAGSAAGAALAKLYVHGSAPFPADPYTDEPLVQRALSYRNHVTHHRRAPFLMDGFGRSVHLHLDPDDPREGGSRDPINVELPRILDVITKACTDVLALL
jgi:hypothetical protein